MYRCDHCQYKAKSPIEYTRHYAIHRHINKVGFPCGVPGCPRTFKLYSSFTTHISRDHQNYRHARHNFQANTNADKVNLNLTCDHCKKLCDNTADVTRHLKEHIRNGVEIECPIYMAVHLDTK
jgi:predicted aldo/keto reductase-like oxidoreductase